MAMQRSELELRQSRAPTPPPEWWQKVWDGLEHIETLVKSHENLPGGAEVMHAVLTLRRWLVIRLEESGGHDA